MAKFTFKLDKEATGLAAVVNSNQSADIKLKRKVCGRIQAPNWATKDNKYGCSFMVKTSDKSCGWKWVTLKYRADSMEDMKVWLQDNTDAIISRYELRFSED